MNILALDTSGKAASAAVARDGKLAARMWLEHGKTHSQALMPCVESLLSLLGADVSEMDIFAAVTGPGSFTGLRIGVTTVKALAFANGAKSAGVSTFECLAHNMLAYGDALLCSVIDARNDQVYYQIFSTDGKTLRSLCSGDVAGIDELAIKLARLLEKGDFGRGVALNGDAAAKCGELFRGKLNGADVIRAPERDLYTDAASVALLVSSEIESGLMARLEGPFLLAPEYLRKPRAERIRGAAESKPGRFGKIANSLGEPWKRVVKLD
jgi:tRNA threonylcarbamoyladenosine biosynthesis protein TsaB